VGGAERGVRRCGRGVAFVTLEAVKRAGRRPDNTRVAVQGFGNVGSVTAKILAAAGCKIVAVSDVSGGYAAPQGIDIPSAIEHVRRHPKRLLEGLPGLSKITNAELDAYLALLRGADGGQALLKIMRGFERTPAKREKYGSVLRDGRYPVQIVWGEDDPALKINVSGERARIAAGLDTIHRLPAKHFLQEDQAPALADLIAKIVSR